MGNKATSLQENKPQPSLFTFFLFNAAIRLSYAWDNDAYGVQNNAPLEKLAPRLKTEFTLK